MSVFEAKSATGAAAVRAATGVDVDRLVETIRAAFAAQAQRYALDPIGFPWHGAFCTPAWIADRVAMGTRFYLAEADGVACGCVGLAPDAEKPGVLSLIKLAVRPEARGRGIGQALVRHALQEARGLGARRVALGAVDEPGLFAWYEKLGFVTDELMVPDHKRYTVSLMHLDL